MKTTITVDYENNAEEFWRYVQTAPNVPPEIKRLEDFDEITVSAERAAEIESWCHGVLGFADGQAFAQNAILFNPADED